MKSRLVTAAALLLAFPASAQIATIPSAPGSELSDHASHMAMQGNASGLPAEGGQAAFAAIQEIVSILSADPATDWTHVDIEALREHLIDMDNVTLHASVQSEVIDGGARFTAIGATPDVVLSIQRMVPAHIEVMNRVDGLQMSAKTIADGAVLTVTGPDATRISGLGFIGIMATGMHHQLHHLAIARGDNPHG